MCVCDVQEVLLKSAWGMLVNNTKMNLENQLDCCGLLNTTSSRIQFDQDVQSCTAVSVTPGSPPRVPPYTHIYPPVLHVFDCRRVKQKVTASPAATRC